MSRGRPTKFDPVITAAILQAVKDGGSIAAAAVQSKIGVTTLRRWLNRGKRTGEADQPYREFRSGYMEAQANAKIRLEHCVYKAGFLDAEMALKILERKYPEAWGQNKNRIRRMEKEIEELRQLLESGHARPSS